MFGSIGRFVARLFGRGEAHRLQLEMVELARQANTYPDNERLILRLADCYLRAQDKPRALSAYWHVVDLYKKRSDWQKAAAILKRIIVLAPSETISRFDVAHCLEKLERRKEAAQQWEMVARMLMATSDTSGAIRCYARAVNLDPTNRQAAFELNRLRPPPQLPKPAPAPKAVPALQPAPARADWYGPPKSKQPHAVKPNLVSLGRAAARDEISQPMLTALDNPLDAFDLGMDGGATREYAAEDLSTLLDDDFDAQTIASEDLPEFDENHRPGDTPLDPLSFAS
jgi:tetratricopeptide (TPR) repeat protein